MRHGSHWPGDGSAALATEADVCVDLDGTLLATDLLWECLAAVATGKPWLLLLVPLWFLRGRAFLKRKLARHAEVDVALLPYRTDVLDHVRQARARGRRIILATAADGRLASRIAQHLGLFDAVLASDGKHNMKGPRKRDAVRDIAGPQGYDFITDSAADLPALQQAKQAWLVGPSRRLLSRTQDACSIAGVFPASPRPARGWFKLLRPHQWVKNLLLFAPVVLAHQVSDTSKLAAASIAFVVFSLCASAVYILNDLIDLDADRRHPEKRHRPLAAGTVPIPHALGTMAALFAGSLAGAVLLLPLAFALLLGFYGVMTTAYSLWFKRQLVLDIIVLAGLYAFRVFAGGIAVDVAVSEWFLAFCMFLFFSLAIFKRCLELRLAISQQKERLNRRDYLPEDLPLLESLGAGCGCLAVLVLCLFLSNSPAVRLYPSPRALWLLAPMLLYWILRLYLLARRGSVLSSDPIAFLLRDRPSYVVAALGGAIFIIANHNWAL